MEGAVEAGTCRICGGAGWVLDAADGRKLAHPCVCRGASIARARLESRVVTVFIGKQQGTVLGFALIAQTPDAPALSKQ